jgi:hypothetical protein
MTMETGINPKKVSRRLAAFILAGVIAGIATEAALLLLPSETGSRLLFGYSPERLLLIAVVLLPAAGMGLLAARLLARRSVSERVHAFLMSEWVQIIAFLGFFFLLDFIIVNINLSVLLLRLFPVLLWYSLVFLLAFTYQLTWSLADPRQAVRKYEFAIMVVGVFFVTYLAYQLYASLLGWMRNPGKAYWHLLAQAFLDGKLYIANPVQTHDMTFFQGHWYLPPPPLPAILMLPYALLVGAASINNVWFSIIFCSINSTLVFLILEGMRRRGWIQLPRAGLLWLVALFALGTPHWWVGVNGMEWFVSQIVAVTFLALATWCAVQGWSPWIVSASLALCVSARPNLVVVWVLLLAIAWQIRKETGQPFRWTWALKWSLQSAVPVAAAAAGLMVYNFLRFGNPLDFGYTMINGAPQIVENARIYGLFNLHFIPGNLYLMFLRLPSFRPEPPYLFPSIEGMSFLLTTPALLYLVHRYEKKWWILGAWALVILSIGMLSLYHNTGAAQYGFRYVLDFIVPLIMLLAYALGKKTTWAFRILVIVSVLINGYGVWWFIHYA